MSIALLSRLDRSISKWDYCIQWLKAIVPSLKNLPFVCLSNRSIPFPVFIRSWVTSHLLKTGRDNYYNNVAESPEQFRLTHGPTLHRPVLLEEFGRRISGDANSSVRSSPVLGNGTMQTLIHTGQHYAMHACSLDHQSDKILFQFIMTSTTITHIC